MTRQRLQIACLVCAFLCAGSAMCSAQSTTIRIRFANGRSGKPLHLKSYEQGVSEGTAKFHVDRVEADSLIVTFQSVQNFAFRSEAFEPCDVAQKGAVPPQYQLQQVIEHGVVAPNYCGHHHATPVPGELLVYSRHAHWWQLTGRVLGGLLICG